MLITDDVYNNDNNKDFRPNVFAYCTIFFSLLRTCIWNIWGKCIIEFYEVVSERFRCVRALNVSYNGNAHATDTNSYPVGLPMWFVLSTVFIYYARFCNAVLKRPCNLYNKQQIRATYLHQIGFWQTFSGLWVVHAIGGPFRMMSV